MNDSTRADSVLVDGHAHLDRSWPLARALDRAVANLRSEAVLCLVQRPGDRPFATLRAVDAWPWRLDPTEESESLVARRRNVGGIGDATLYLVAGRQIRASDGLEVLALGIAPDDPRLPMDGLSLGEIVARVRAAGAPAVVPWGFGKWWGARGRRVGALFDDEDSSSEKARLFLGDTSLRPGLATPALFAHALRRGVRLLPGSDPLPVPGGDARLGSRGFVLEGPIDPRRPAAWLRERLADAAPRPEPWGRPRSLVGAIVDQVRLRLHGRRRPRRSPTATHGGPRILMVAPQPFFTPRGTPFSVRQRIAALAELGVGVDLLTYGEGDDVDLPGLRIRRLPRLPIGPVPIGPSWRKLVLDALLAPWTAWRVARGHTSGDLVGPAPPAETPSTASSRSRTVQNRPGRRGRPYAETEATGNRLGRRGRPYAAMYAHEEAVFWCRLWCGLLPSSTRPALVYDMHSSLPEHLRVFGHSRLAVSLFEILERWSLDGADAVLTVSPELARRVDERIGMGKGPTRHLLLENTYPLDDEGDDAPGGRQEEVETSDRRVVFYAGSFEPYQGLDLLVDAFARVRERRDDARLVLVGGTPAQIDALRRRAAGSGLVEGRDIELPGRLAPAGARARARKAAVQVSPRVAGPTPLKIYSMLADGVPIVATRGPFHEAVLDDDVARLAEPTPEALAAAILETLSDALDGAKERVTTARARHAERYGRDVYLEKLRRLLVDLEILPGRVP